MRVRVTLARTVRQYVDLQLASVESLEQAHDAITADLAQPDRRARMLAGEKWFGEDHVTDIEVVEVISIDK